MAMCDVCGNFDDGHIEAPTKMFPSTKTALPDYNPDLYYYWDSPCLLYTSPSPRDVEESRMPSSA